MAKAKRDGMSMKDWVLLVPRAVVGECSYRAEHFARTGRGKKCEQARGVAYLLVSVAMIKVLIEPLQKLRERQEATAQRA